MRHLAVIAALLAAPALAAEAPRTSWGKPGVSFADYRADSLACGHRAYDLDIADTSQARAFVAASTRVNTLFDLAETAGAGSHVGDDGSSAAAGGYYGTAAREAEAINPRQKVAELHQLLDGTLARCLTDRGYRRFRLTDDQRRRVSHLKFGSDARRAYLHQLAADPAILDAQGFADQPNR